MCVFKLSLLAVHLCSCIVHCPSLHAVVQFALVQSNISYVE